MLRIPQAIIWRSNFISHGCFCHMCEVEHYRVLFTQTSLLVNVCNLLLKFSYKFIFLRVRNTTVTNMNNNELIFVRIMPKKCK